jgi:eukaryotic-like serine/threonine-protein kinase
MSPPPSIETDEQGRAVVVKTGAGEQADRRRHEAAVLRRAQHPGVVQLLEVRDREGEVEIRLDHVPGPSLATHPPLGATRLAQIGAAVAATLSDVHALGIVHGNLGPDHVLVTSDGRVVVCGFADAASVRSDDADPCGLPPRVDVIQLGRLLRRLLDASLEADATPPRSVPADRLGRVADAAADPDGPIDSAAEFARRLGQVAGSEPTPEAAPSAARPGPRRRSHRRGRPAVVLGVCAGAAVVLATGVVVAPRLLHSAGRAAADPEAGAAPDPEAGAAAGPEAGVAADPEARAATVPDSSTPATSSLPPRQSGPVPSADPVGQGELVLAASRSCPEVGAGAAADVDGNGCPEPWRVITGGLEVGGRHYALGGPDDLVAVGDWDCDGIATPALVERASGSVFLFDVWATEDAEVTAAAVGLVSAPIAVEVGRSACDSLVVTSGGGETSTYDDPGEVP